MIWAKSDVQIRPKNIVISSIVVIQKVYYRKSNLLKQMNPKSLKFIQLG
jgi:hypothetical protein